VTAIPSGTDNPCEQPSIRIRLAKPQDKPAVGENVYFLFFFIQKRAFTFFYIFWAEREFVYEYAKAY